MLGLSLLAGLTTAVAQPAFLKGPDRISVDRRNQVLELSWSDTEDRLQGSIQPYLPRAGEPLKVLLHVGSFDGPTFDGPVTITLREPGSPRGQVQTVKKGAVNWVTTFTPESTGLYQLDVSFRTTRLKVLHAEVEVTDPPVPRFVLWVMVGIAATVALGYGIRSVVRKDRSDEPHPVLAELAAQPSPAPPPPAAESPAEPAPEKPPETPSSL
ncbi:hypothetical protein DB31_2745 [Hyalangium minutum]|uniref:Uncharacterized protein n=1 Tax=Hyalangium minutum TaxID=394096 RepID=A0A085W639_9BACT|nr:hypothetical protein DB31_2745 [Hyalangium minutum]